MVRRQLFKNIILGLALLLFPFRLIFKKSGFLTVFLLNVEKNPQLGTSSSTDFSLAADVKKFFPFISEKQRLRNLNKDILKQACRIRSRHSKNIKLQSKNFYKFNIGQSEKSIVYCLWESKSAYQAYLRDFSPLKSKFVSHLAKNGISINFLQGKQV